VRVEWDHEAAMTPHGQLPFFIDFLKTAGLFDAFVADCPLRYGSPNALKKRDVLGTAMLTGAKRYAHIAALRGDAVLPAGRRGRARSAGAAFRVRPGREGFARQAPDRSQLAGTAGASSVTAGGGDAAECGTQLKRERQASRRGKAIPWGSRLNPHSVPELADPRIRLDNRQEVLPPQKPAPECAQAQPEGTVVVTVRPLASVAVH
jgi:hypothetical protein